MNGAFTSLTPIDRSQAAHIRAEHLHGGTVHDASSADCALLRSCIWTLCHAAAAPVHVLRVLNLALSVGESVAELPQRREQLRETLEELSDAGDAVSLPEGRWYPAPTREVRLEGDADERLLVGGLPTSILPQSLRGQIRHHGPYRRVNGSTLSTLLQLPTEGVDSWAGAPQDSLETWSMQLLNTKLEPYNAPRDESRLLIYVPELAMYKTPQAKRWFERPAALSGRYLAARDRIFGAREYRIVELREGAIVAIGAFPAPGESRRLMYALDTRANKSVEVRVRTDNDRLALTIRSELPRAELRLFAAIGTLEVGEEAYYPRTWWFAERYRGMVLHRLHNLGVTIIEATTRRSQS